MRYSGTFNTLQIWVLRALLFLILTISFSCCKHGYSKKESEQINLLKRNLQFCESYSKEIDNLFKENMEDFSRSHRTQKWNALQVKLFPYYCKISMDNGTNPQYVDSINLVLNKINAEYKNKSYYLKKSQLNDTLDYLYFKTNIIGTILETQELLSKNLPMKPLNCSGEHYFLFLPKKKSFQSNEKIEIEIHPLRYARATFRNYCSLYEKEKIISKQILTDESPYFKYNSLKKGEYRLECKGYEIFQESQKTLEAEEPSVQSVFIFEVK